MGRTVARYTVKPGLEEHNAELVRAVYRELTELRPDGFSYVTYLLDDGRTFIHIAEQEGDADTPLPSLTAFREFQAGIRDRCEWGPRVSRAEVVGRRDPID
jgi:hypothetical protein